MPERLLRAAERLRGVAIEHPDALALIPGWDFPNTVIYCDPPYTGEHRLRASGRSAGGKRGYRHDDHPDLGPSSPEFLLRLEHAAVLLSGYPCGATHELEDAGWEPLAQRTRRHAGNRRGAAGQPAPETVWLNPVCAHTQRPLTLATDAPHDAPPPAGEW